MLHFILDLIKYVFPFVFIASIVLLIMWSRKSKEDQDRIKADKSTIGKIYNGLVSSGMFFAGAAGSNNNSDNESYHNKLMDDNCASVPSLETDTDNDYESDDYYECDDGYESDDGCYIDLDEKYDLTEEDTDE